MADGLSIPLQWKVIGVAFGLLSFVAGIGGSYIYVLTYGENKCVADQKVAGLTAENANLKTTLENIQNGIQNLQKKEDSIRNSGLPNPDLGPNMRNALDGLRADHKSGSGR